MNRPYYDVWLPELAPSAALMAEIHAAMKAAAPEAVDERTWHRFAGRYRREMASPEHVHLLQLLAALSRHSALAVGCYCENEARCHRSLLRELLAKEAAIIEG